jgi:zinc protease
VYYAGLQLQIRDDDADYPALVLANYMLGGGFLNSRLAVRVRQQEGLSYGIGSQLNASSLDRVGTFMVYAIYAPQNLDKLEAAIKDELERAIKEGFTAEEISAAKSGWLQSRQVSRAQDAELAGKLSTYQFINRTMAWDALLEQQVTALTPIQITAALQRQLNLQHLNIVKAGDFAQSKPETSQKR